MGLLATRRLAEAGRAVTLFEAGSPEPDLGGSEAFDDHAANSLDLRSALGQGLGGTGRWWAGQCVFPPPGDLSVQTCQDAASWPVTEQELRPWAELALRLVQIDTATKQAQRRMTRSPTELASFQSWPTIYLARHRLDRTWAKAVLRHDSVTTVTGMRVNSVTANAGGLLLQVRCEAGHLPTVRVREVVIAAGALGNAGILLRSRSQGLPVGEACGRFLSEHLTVPVAAVASDDPRRVISALGTGYTAGRRYWPKLALRAKTRRELDLPAAAADMLVTYRSQIAKAREILTPRRGGGSRPDLRAMPVAVRALLGLGLARASGSAVDLAAVAGLRMQLNVEQPPRWENRLELTAADQLAVHWTVDQQDLMAIRRISGLLVRQWPRPLGILVPLSHLNSDEELRANIGTAHHLSGTTRMGRSTVDSVVDAHQRLHGDPRVVVIGASVFPTAGWVNPTLLGWATTLRALDPFCRP